LHDENQIDDMSAELIERLRRVDRPLPVVTTRVDRELRHQAEMHFRGRDSGAARWYRVGWAAAAAVVLAIAVLQLRGPGAGEPAMATSDFDGSGQVDIADVLFYARMHGSGEQPAIDALAMRIVALHAEGGAT